MREKLDKQKSSNIRMLKIIKVISYIFLILTIFVYSIFYIAIISYPDLYTTDEFINLLVLNTIFFILFLALSLSFIFIVHRHCKAIINKIKKEGNWKNYGNEIYIFEPMALLHSCFYLYAGSFSAMLFIFINDKDYLFTFVMFLFFFLISISIIYFFRKYENRYRNYEIINLGKISYKDSKEQIENILKELELKYKKSGSKNALKLKVDETYLVDNDFEILLASTVKEELSKIWWPESIRFTRVIVGKITKDNKRVVRKVQQEIEKLKVNA